MSIDTMTILSDGSPDHDEEFRNREFRLFITSTTRDICTEREHITEHVLPGLQRYVEQHNLQSTHVNLCWEDNESDRGPGAVMRRLDEIIRNKSIFIGLVADGRNLIGNGTHYPWLTDLVNELHNVAAVEIIEEILSNPLMRERSLFYIRKPLHTAKPIAPDSAEWAERIANMHERIMRSGHSVREYSSSEALSAFMYEDLVGMVNRLYPVNDSPLKRERRKHEMFAAIASHRYVELLPYLEMLDAHIESVMPPLVVTGPSGSGKSTMLAYWSEYYRRKHPAVFFLAHYVDATLGKDRVTLVRRIIAEIRERFGITIPIPEDEHILDDVLPFWLAHVQSEHMVLVIDGLEKLDDPHILDWILQHFPPNVRVIVSIEEGAWRKDLVAEDWNVLKMQPLSMHERWRVIERILRLSTKSVDEDVPDRILPESVKDNSLVSRASLIEGRTEFIEQYLTVDSLEQLFELQLAHIEDRHGMDTARVVLSLIWASRFGLSQTELLELTRMKYENLTALLRDLEQRLVHRNGRLTFLHPSIHTVIISRYGIVAGIERKLHRRLAAYFTRQSVSIRRAEEEPWHWMHAHAWSELKTCITSPPLFLVLSANKREEDLLKYWAQLAKRFDPAKEYRARMQGLRDQLGATTPLYGVTLEHVGRFLIATGHHLEAINSLSEALTIHKDIFGVEHPETAVMQAKLKKLMGTS